MVVMKAGGRAVAMRERAWRAERAESAGGFSGKPMVMLQRGKQTVRVAKTSPNNPPTQNAQRISVLYPENRREVMVQTQEIQIYC